MGIIRITGKVLEISGKIIQAEGVEDYLENKGKELLEKWVVKTGAQALSSEEQREKVVEALRKPLHSRAFASAVDKTFDEFLNDVERVCQVTWSAGAIGSDTTALLPIALVQDCALSLSQNRIAGWAEFKRLYDSELLRQAFFEEWRMNAIKAILGSAPSPENPFEIGDRRWIVFTDPEAYWAEDVRPGAFYIHRSSKERAAENKQVQFRSHIDQLDEKRGRLTEAQLTAEVRSALSIKQRIETSVPTSEALWDMLGIEKARLALKVSG